MHRSKRLQASKYTAVKDDGDSSKLWCLCQEPEDSRFMIQCDVQGSNCKIWYHGDCVGVSKSQGKRMERCGKDLFVHLVQMKLVKMLVWLTVLLRLL